MSEMDNALEHFHESFDKMDGDFHVLEYQVPVNQQMEYFKYSLRIRREAHEMGDEEYRTYLEELQDADLDLDKKKQVLSLLASSKQVRAYRLLENYAQHPDKELANWAYMALMESRILLESELSGKKQIYISTGLGGKGDKLRFYALILSLRGIPFLDYQRGVITKELTYALPKNHCEIERLTIERNYVELLFLMPFKCDMRQMLLNVIHECNLYGNFLSDTFTVTNVKELSRKEIENMIAEHGTD